MSNDPIREKFEQAAIDLRLAYRDPDHGVVLFHGIDKLFDVAYRAGRASVIEEMKPTAWEVTGQGVFKTRLTAEAVAAVHGRDIIKLAPAPKE